MPSVRGSRYRAAEERRDQIAEMTRQGMTAPQIAEKLGVTVRTVCRARRDRDCQVLVPRRFTVEEIALAEALFVDGCSCAEVARTLGRAPAVIWEKWPDRAWTRVQAAEYRALMRQARRLVLGI